LQAYAALIGVLLLGVVIGSGATFAYLRDPGRNALAQDSGRARRLEALTRELTLSPEQRTRVEGILEASSGEREKRMRAMFEACGEPVREHKRRVDSEIRATLTPEQQRRFDAIAEEQSRRYFPRRDETTETGKQ
jgi:hypothetical protein